MRLLVGFTCIVMAVGCSDDDKVRRLPDAPPPPDADVDASTFGPVTLTVLQGVEPQVGVKVIFQNADSSVVSETTTGTDGKASANMAPGGYVTAFDPFPNVPQGIQSSQLRTFAGVKPGDQLKLTIEPFSSPPSIDVTVIVPVAPNAIDYRISTNCYLGYQFSTGGSGGQPQATIQLSGCGATSNLLVEALNGNGAVISSIYKQSVALTNNGTIDLTQDTYTAAPDVTFSYTNVPAASGSVNINALRVTSLGRILDFNQFVGVAAGAATLTTKLPAIANATAVTTSMIFGNSTQHMITEWGPPASTYALDVGTSVLPDFNGEPTLDVPNHRITWANVGGGVQADLVYVTAFLRRDTPTQRWTWEIVAPGTTQAVLPVLPSSQATFNPIDGDLANFDARTAKVPGGYDAVRANILSEGGLDLFVGSATGKAQANNYVNQKAIAKPPAPTGILRGLRRR